MSYFFVPFTFILFVVEWIFGLLFALLAILCAEFICIPWLCLRKDGNLRQPLRALFQPADNPAWGDALWRADNPNLSNYRLACSYIRRNAGYGFQSLAACPIPATVTIFGNDKIHDSQNGIAGWYFALGSNGFWEFVWIKDRGNGKCWRGEYGWSIKNSSPVMAGSLQVVLIARQYDFTK